MEQLGLIFTPPRARRRDPSTSQRAAAKVGRFERGHYAAILAALAVAPGTYTEIADRCGIERHAVARRLPELQEGERCVPTGEERDGRRVWRLA